MRSARASLAIVVLTGGLLAGAVGVVEAQDDSTFVPMDGRVARPEDGFAITLPAGWIAQNLTSEVHWALFGIPPLEDDTSYLWMQEEQSGAGCVLSDFTAFALKHPAYASLDEAAFDLAGYKDEVHFVETPAGEVACVIGVDQDGWVNERYVYLLAERWFLLDCAAPGTDEGTWTLARSLESVAAE